MLKVVKEMFCQHSPTTTEHKTETSEGKFLLMDSSLPWKKGPAEAGSFGGTGFVKGGSLLLLKRDEN
jgi:hypothetical protein